MPAKPEAILLGLLVAVSFVTMILLRGMDLGATGFSNKVLERAQGQAEAFWSIPWYLSLQVGLFQKNSHPNVILS